MDTSTANLVVHMTGLGIMAVNKKKNRVETMFIHDDKHRIKVELFKPVSDAKEKEIRKNDPELKAYKFLNKGPVLNGRAYEKINDQKLEGLADTKISVEISGTKKSALSSPKLHGSANFKRSLGNKNEFMDDFGWVVNLRREGVLCDGAAKPKKVNKASKLPSSLVSVANALFYTEKIAQEQQGKKGDWQNAVMWRANVTKNARTGKASFHKETAAQFGMVGETIGAMISAAESLVTIKKGRKRIEIPVTNNTAPTLVVISNLPPPDSEGRMQSESDINIYRQFYKVNGNSNFDIVLESELESVEEKGGSPVFGRVFCFGAFEEGTDGTGVF